MKFYGSGILSANGLWFRNFTKGFLTGAFINGPDFEVVLEYLDDLTFVVLLIDGEHIGKPLLAMTQMEQNLLPYRLIDDWSEQYWQGVDKPALWAAAGFTPAESRHTLAFPLGHPERPTEQALEILISLQHPLRINKKKQ